MKQVKFTHLLKTVFATLFTILTSQFANAQVVGYTLASDNAATSGMSYNYPSQGRVLNISSGLSLAGYGTSGQTCYGWDDVTNNNSYWQTSAFSTAGYTGISVSCQMKASSIGPKDFKAQYSTNGSSWTDVVGATKSLTTSLSNFTFNLPSPQCENNPTVYIRWIQNSLLDVNGDPLGSADPSISASLKGITIAGTSIVPSNQASSISIISVTNTTITIGCTTGNGTQRIIKMNTTNSFTNPSDDSNPTANSTYGSGEQVVYNGAGSGVTVTVPAATNLYYFRIFEANQLGSTIRYNTSTAADNPKLCQLESISLPTYTNIRLTTATLGATIGTPLAGTITDRGIYWSTTAGVNEAANQVSEGNTSGGLYTFVVSNLSRSRTIYFKGYVTNGSGTIMSEESSFTNIPIFSGTGNWSDNTKWNVLQVPGSGNTFGSTSDKPVIDGTCTQNVSTIVSNLTINSGKNLTINPAVSMKVNATLTNNAGTSGILIKSSASAANGSLIFATGNPFATVEMYSKANWNLSNPVNNKYKWQFFGIPVKTITAGNTFSGLLGYDGNSTCFVREWDESSVGTNNVWVIGGASQSLYKSSSSILDQNHGYELVQQNPTTYTFAGELLNTNFTQALSYSPSGAFAGQHIFGNPYTAAISIAAIQFGSNTEQAVYLYNTGTYNDWSSSNGVNAPGNGPGQYTVSTPGTAGGGGVPSQIPTAGSFLVKSINATGSITIQKSTGLVANSDQQRVKGLVQTTSDKVNTRIDVIGQNFSDRMWIFTFPTCTRNFDNGFDGRKMLGIAGTTQLYSIENDGVYQINAVNDMNESYLGFQPGNDTNFKLVFNHENTSSIYGSIYLIDLVADKTIDITQSGTEYAFTATASDATTRFKIVTQTTGTVNPSDKKMNIFNTDEAIYVQNFTDRTATYMLYNTSGKLMQRLNINANSIKTISIQDLNAGVYIAISETETDKVTQRLIIR